MKLNSVLITLCFLPVLLACNYTTADKSLFTLTNNSGIQFKNTVHDTKEQNIFSYRNFYNGGGVGIGDINNDGLADVFFTANQGSNKLYLNKGNLKFQDISDKAGFKVKKQWSTGVVMVDINSDGWLDIFVCNAGNMQDSTLRRNQLFINNHNLTFTESAAMYGLDNAGYTTQVSFFDYDLDGDLDCFMINNSPISPNNLNNENQRNLPDAQWPIDAKWKGGGDHLLRNDDGKFSEVTTQAGIHGSLISFGLGVTVGDVNGDNYPDVYVSNDYFERDYLYINQKDGTFKDEAEQWLQHTSLASMGADIGDINNDGYPDISTTDMLPNDDYRLKTTLAFEDINVYRLKEKNGFYHQFFQNTLQLNNKNGKFTDIANYAGVSATDWSWGGLLFDADNDGLSDIYVCNGIFHDLINQDFIDFFANDVVHKMMVTGKKEEVEDIINKMPSQPLPNKAFKNLGNLKFEDAGNNWGFTQPSFSNGAAYSDLDNDGDLDLVINNVNEKAFVYRNNSREINKSNFIGVLLKGKEKNTFAIGSTIKLYCNKDVLTREVIPSRGFQSSVDYKQIIGLGNRQVDSMIIGWPDKTYSKYYHPVINTVHIIQKTTEKETLTIPPSNAIPQLLTTLRSNFDKHNEDDYVDYYYERLVPCMTSREGPKAACADVNDDGLQDVYIGGAANQAGQLYMQTANGFEKSHQKLFDQFSDFEDVAVLFFDCDNDGDQDLFIGSGGNRNLPFSHVTQHRLYINDGKGNFSINTDAFSPNENENISVAVANDFDNDGDTDLFVGGRSVPGNYGITPKSYLYINNGKGEFTDIAKTKNSDIANIGMVTGAVWANVYGDEQKELVIVGEWMTPRVYTYTGNNFKKVKTNLNNLYGWWQTIAATDFNGDGKDDLVLGNIGENFYLCPNSRNPVKMFINDFDENGETDKIITRNINGKDVPVFMKRELTEQLPSLKKQILKNEDYAKKSVQDLFSPELIKKSETKEFNYATSVIAINQGNGIFSLKKMAAMVQLSSVNAVLCSDVNNDGFTDLILGGNKYDFLPQFSRLDASFGHVMLNDGKANFTELPASQSGFQLTGEIKDIQNVIGKKGDYMLVLRNDDYPVLYKSNKTW